MKSLISYNINLSTVRGRYMFCTSLIEDVLELLPGGFRHCTLEVSHLLHKSSVESALS